MINITEIISEKEDFIKAILNGESYYLKIRDGVYLASYQATINGAYDFIIDNINSLCSEESLELYDCMKLEEEFVADTVLHIIDKENILPKLAIEFCFEGFKVYLINNKQIIKNLY